MSLITEIEHLDMIQNIEMIVRSDRVFENCYDKDSPEVIQWTEHFTKRANIPEIFGEVGKRISTKKFLHAEIVGTFWHHFSALAPQVMSIASAKVDNNLMRHYIVQIIFEELGTRNHRLIHPDLFLDAIESIGVTTAKRKKLVRKHLSKLGFTDLVAIMNEAKSNSEILGILLGLEIDANENIQTIFEALTFNVDAYQKIKETPFFKIHRIAEDEHIRLDVANFLRFCKSDDEKEKFSQGFDKSVIFWKNYWDAIASIIDSEVIV
jgi:hypothetical protein